MLCIYMYVLYMVCVLLTLFHLVPSLRIETSCSREGELVLANANITFTFITLILL